MKDFLHDDRAISILMQYLMLSGAGIGLFAILMLSLNSVFLENPSNIVMEKRFSDIGNQISTNIIDMYIVVPDNGELETDLIMPAKAGGDYYEVNESSDPLGNQMISVAAMHSTKNVVVTLNGIARTMRVEGTTISSQPSHKLTYSNLWEGD
jgi:hypothetical protein